MVGAWWWVGVAWAGPEEGVAKLIEAGDFEKAQKKCEDVTLDDLLALREVCAKACLPAAQQQNTVPGWQAYLQRWRGTTLEGEAHEAEAGAALYAAGYGGKESDYAALLAQYPDTVVAPALTERMGAAAIRDAYDAGEAARIARKYPGHEQLPSLVERYLDAFVKVALEETGPVLTVDPPAGVKPEDIAWSWVVRAPDGASRPWVDVAEEHLTGLGLPQAFVGQVKKPGPQPFPPCLPEGIPGELGLELTLETAKAFVPAPIDPACAATAPPALFVIAKGRISALSLAPGHRVALPASEVDAKAPWFPWRDPSGVTNVLAPLPTGNPMLAGSVIGQPVGPATTGTPSLFLLSPIAGGMPWYLLASPPPGAIPLPVDFRSAPLPSGWSFQAGGAPITSGTATVDPVNVRGGTADWWLPAGDPRVLPRLFARITGMNGENPAIKRPRGESLPPATSGFTLTGQLAGPPGSASLEFEPLDKAGLSQLPPALATLGITVSRAWRIDLGPDGPHVAFEGTGKGGIKVHGVTDKANRVFTWVRDERAQTTPELPFAFRWRDRSYFAWTGKGSAGPYVEAIHFEGIGLVREFR